MSYEQLEHCRRGVNGCDVVQCGVPRGVGIGDPAPCSRREASGLGFHNVEFNAGRKKGPSEGTSSLTRRFPLSQIPPFLFR